MSVKAILQLGNPLLYDVSRPITESEVGSIRSVVDDLHDTMMDFRNRYGCGRAIAAPQIGVLKRLLYMHIDRPAVFINPVLENRSSDMMILWDDCMSFPDLLVRVQRHKTCTIRYRDLDWSEQVMPLAGDLSELLQHEYDHLDGILATQRAIDDRSFAFRSQRHLLDGPVCGEQS